MKNKWPKTDEKTKFGGTLGFSLQWRTQEFAKDQGIGREGANHWTEGRHPPSSRSATLSIGGAPILDKGAPPAHHIV